MSPALMYSANAVAILALAVGPGPRHTSSSCAKARTTWCSGPHSPGNRWRRAPSLDRVGP